MYSKYIKYTMYMLSMYCKYIKFMLCSMQFVCIALKMISLSLPIIFNFIYGIFFYIHYTIVLFQTCWNGSILRNIEILLNILTQIWAKIYIIISWENKKKILWLKTLNKTFPQIQQKLLKMIFKMIPEIIIKH